MILLTLRIRLILQFSRDSLIMSLMFQDHLESLVFVAFALDVYNSSSVFDICIVNARCTDVRKRYAIEGVPNQTLLGYPMPDFQMKKAIQHIAC